MGNAKKGQVNEISDGALDRGIRFYKLPRLIFEALGVKPTFTEIILGFATIADGVKMAKARKSLKPDDQRLRLIRAGKLSDENIVDLFDVLLTSKRMNPVDLQSLAQEEHVTDSPSLLLQFVNGIEHQQSDTWFTLVLDFFRECLLDDLNAIKRVKSAPSLVDKATRLSEGFADRFGIYVDVHAATGEQEFLLRAAVVKRFAVLTELVMMDNLEDFKEFSPIYEALLPKISEDEKLVVSSKMLMQKMFDRWAKTRSQQDKKEDFYRYITLRLDGANAIGDSYKDRAIDSRKVKKQIQRWESGQYRLKLNEFWCMFDWAFPELLSDDASDSSQPLQILMLVLTTNLFTRLQQFARDFGLAPATIVQEFSDYRHLSYEGKTEFKKWLTKQEAL